MPFSLVMCPSAFVRSRGLRGLPMSKSCLLVYQYVNYVLFVLCRLKFILFISTVTVNYFGFEGRNMVLNTRFSGQ